MSHLHALLSAVFQRAFVVVMTAVMYDSYNLFYFLSIIYIQTQQKHKDLFDLCLSKT